MITRNTILLRTSSLFILLLISDILNYAQSDTVSKSAQPYQKRSIYHDQPCKLLWNSVSVVKTVTGFLSSAQSKRQTKESSQISNESTNLELCCNINHLYLAEIGPKWSLKTPIAAYEPITELSEVKRLYYSSCNGERSLEKPDYHISREERSSLALTRGVRQSAALPGAPSQQRAFFGNWSPGNISGQGAIGGRVLKPKNEHNNLAELTSEPVTNVVEPDCDEQPGVIIQLNKIPGFVVGKWYLRCVNFTSSSEVESPNDAKMFTDCESCTISHFCGSADCEHSGHWVQQSTYDVGADRFVIELLVGATPFSLDITTSVYEIESASSEFGAHLSKKVRDLDKTRVFRVDMHLQSHDKEIMLVDRLEPGHWYQIVTCVKIEIPETFIYSHDLQGSLRKVTKNCLKVIEIKTMDAAYNNGVGSIPGRVIINGVITALLRVIVEIVS